MTAEFDPREITPRADELAGRVIAITGASDGIGRALAVACARHGANVILIGRNSRKLEQVHSEIEAAGWPDATIAVLDLEKALAQDYDRLAQAVMERFGRLDGLVHNAAILGMLAPIEHYDVPTWCRVLHVNVTAAFALTQVLLPALKQSQGRIRPVHDQQRRQTGPRVLGCVRGFEVRRRRAHAGARRRAAGHLGRARQRDQSRPRTHAHAPSGLPVGEPGSAAGSGRPRRAVHRAARSVEPRHHRPELRLPACSRRSVSSSFVTSRK